MKLVLFRVRNFRSINDSGEIAVSQITAMLGRNESGKSNLLRALHSLNPADGFKALKPIKDFPRHRPLDECNDWTSVVESRWVLDDEDKAALLELLPRFSDVSEVSVGRRYAKSRHVGFIGAPSLTLDESAVKSAIKKIVAAAQAAADKLEDATKAQLNDAAIQFETAAAPVSDSKAWGTAASAAIQALRKALARADAELTDKQNQVVDELDDLAVIHAREADLQQKARDLVIERLPRFVYVDEYPELSGHQNISEFLTRKTEGRLTQADENFEKLCTVAGLDPKRLQELLGQQDAETRNQLANRASAVITGQIRRLWKDRQLKIRFNLDAQHLDTFVSDPNSLYDVEVNLNERSRGFQWFFSFYVTFAADTQSGDASNAILLLDEPGLYLHARSQGDLLAHFEKDFENQIIFTTHSPFMVPTQRLDAVRTVNIAEESGTTVTNDPTGDSRTLFPLQAALGYNIAQGLFIGSNNLVVEGVTDFWYLSTASATLIDSGRSGLSEEMTITPAGGAQKVSYLVALLTAERQNVLVLFDSEKEAQRTRDELVRNKLISAKNVLFVADAFEPSAPQEADIEDLLDPEVFDKLVLEAYKADLAGKKLKPNPHVPRIVKRYELAFEEVGLSFNKVRPARLWLSRMSKEPGAVFSGSAASRFSKLFDQLNAASQALQARASEPFA